MIKHSINELEDKIGYQFKDKQLLEQALTHSSYANERKINPKDHYERLEFLGDAVLELVSSDFLFRTYTTLPEGKLTKMRASIVCEQALASRAADIGLADFMLLGKGEEATGGRKRESIISDVMEAVIGAIYLDGGLKEAENYIKRIVIPCLDEQQIIYDSKTLLQEYAQGVLKKGYYYEVVGESGPEHDKLFEVEVKLDGKPVGRGQGKTKKSAEQKAAYTALLNLKRNEQQ